MKAWMPFVSSASHLTWRIWTLLHLNFIFARRSVFGTFPQSLFLLRQFGTLAHFNILLTLRVWRVRWRRSASSSSLPLSSSCWGPWHLWPGRWRSPGRRRTGWYLRGTPADPARMSCTAGNARWVWWWRCAERNKRQLWCSEQTQRLDAVKLRTRASSIGERRNEVGMGRYQWAW